jgi:hypothetical protein
MASILSAGTTSATAMVHTADTSGVLQLASNNGTVALTVDTSQNVGIGTTPNAKFEVNGQIRSSGSDARAVYLYGAAGVKPYIDINEYGVGDFFIGAGSTTSGVLSIGPTLASASALNIDRNSNFNYGQSNTYTASTGTSFGVFTKSQDAGTLLVVSNQTNGASASAQLVLGSYGADWTISNGALANTNSSTALSFLRSNVLTMMLDGSGNVNIGSNVTPNTGSLSNRFLQLVAYGYGSVGTASSNGILNFTCNISANTATTFLTCADIDKWGGVILISYVRDADQNRSGMMMVRYRYSRTYTTLLTDSQNSGATFSVSANNLQVTIGGAGTYLCQFTIWGSAGP